ncbi:MAG: 4-hydroxy-tetrahydrodipicolinate reductase [Alphaproteobacteria bacterium]|nr:4-hydroxy-tetrahydrodipicolinate reductase [Alphaproteobacteria bacterium]
MTESRIGIVGCAGRMGRMLAREVAAAADCVLAGGTETPGSAAVGKDMAALAGLEPIGVVVGDDPVDLFAAVDVVIDFTVPAATVRHAALAAQAPCALVIGTTGLDNAAQDKVAAAARHAPIVMAGNMSVGVNLLVDLVRQVAGVLGPGYDIEVVEMHHRNKVDAPSGTALMLGRAAAEGRGADLEAVARMARQGQVGPRPEGEIGFATLRGGDVVGEHQVIFAGDGERVVLGHIASDRRLFAKGAVRAALWARGQAPGLYSMVDVLGL